MAPLLYLSFRKVLLLYLVLFIFNCVFLCASSNDHQLENKQFLGGRRMLLEVEEEYQEQQKPKNKITTNLVTKKNQTKLIKAPNLSSKNQTKIKTTLSTSTKNQTKLIKSTNSTKPSLTSLSKIGLKKLNSTLQIKKLNSTSSQFKKLNSTTSKPTNSTKKTSDLLKVGSPKNKTTKPTSPKQAQVLIDKKLTNPDSQNPKTTQTKPTTQMKKQPSSLDQDEEHDLISEFRDLPSRFQQTLLPDLETISLTSKKYLNRANKEMTRGFKPYVGNKYAPTIASIVSFAFILIPLLLVSLIFNRIKAYFSLQKVLIFIQVYLSIYFSILCLSSLVTGLEPLRFLYATSQSTYVCLMVMQTLGYVLYLLLLLMYLILIFSTDCGLSSKFLGLAQTFVGFAVGLHCYVAVFHRVVLNQPPKTNWQVHGIYATCFLVICLFAGAERGKKAYVEDGGEEGKKN